MFDPRMNRRTARRSESAAVFMMLLGIALWLAVAGTVFFVAGHFILKYW